jgi:hypothetical protein
MTFDLSSPGSLLTADVRGLAKIEILSVVARPHIRSVKSSMLEGGIGLQAQPSNKIRAAARIVVGTTPERDTE